ncbi:tubulin beta chain-like [Prorops nasuta]|uniref:tubulin beta chain-like n=1 Tax=Prorops nasuta TaxID=863751 RepID=UPI0034CF1D59
MREIIQIQIGGCGNRIGLRFWEVIASEHCLNECGKSTGRLPFRAHQANIFFDLGADKTFYPRAIFVDQDVKIYDDVAANNLGHLFRPANFVIDPANIGNNWAKGFYTEGRGLTSRCLDVVRRESERCHLVQGMQIVHSMGGATGGGMGSLLLTHLREEYPDRILSSIAILPHFPESSSTVEPYNTVLSLKFLKEQADQCFVIDNLALDNICTNIRGNPHARYNQKNNMVSVAMSGFTTHLRFPGPLNSDMRTFVTNMVPFRGLHFFVPGFVSFGYKNWTFPELAQKTFTPETDLGTYDVNNSKHIAAAAIFRGPMSTNELLQEISNIEKLHRHRFTNAIPEGVRGVMCPSTIKGFPKSITTVLNTTGIQQMLQKSHEQCRKMLQRKAFLHYYLTEGMEIDQFHDSISTLEDLLYNYSLFEKEQ